MPGSAECSTFIAPYRQTLRIALPVGRRGFEESLVVQHRGAVDDHSQSGPSAPSASATIAAHCCGIGDVGPDPDRLAPELGEPSRPPPSAAVAVDVDQRDAAALRGEQSLRHA